MAQTQINGGTQIRSGSITSDRLAPGTVAIGGTSVGQNVFTAATREAARAAINCGPTLSDLYTSFIDKADGADLSVGDDGVAVVLRDVDMQVKDGLLQDPGLNGTTYKASYRNQDLDGAKRIGASFKIGSGSTDDFGVVTLVLWEYPIPTPYRVPNTPLHLSIGKSFWQLSVWQGGDQSTSATPTYLATVYFDEPLADDWDPDVPGSGTLHRVEACINGDTMTIVLPDGSTYTLTDSRFESIPATVACHELYRHTANSAVPAFEEIWADTRESAPGSASICEVARVVKRAADDVTEQIALWSPTYGIYRTASNGDITVPSSTTAIPNIPTLTFTVPAGCTAAMFEASLYYAISSSATLILSAKQGGATYETRYVAAMSSYSGILTYSGLMTSLTPGTSQTITLQHRVVSGSGATLKMNSSYPVMWKVTPVRATTA